MRNIKNVVQGMLTENTGIALCDSGMDNNRNWQRNQNIDFDSQPEVVAEFDVDVDSSTEDIYYSISVYHYITKYLEFDTITEQINDMLVGVRETSNSDEYPHWNDETFDSVLNWADEVGLSIENVQENVNTYNYDSSLSQCLLIKMFEIYDEYYALIQIHGGADVRGGYTDAVCFKLPNIYGCLVMPIEDVDGTITTDDKIIHISNSYDGNYLYNDDYDSDGFEQYVPLSKNSVIELYLREI